MMQAVSSNARSDFHERLGRVQAGVSINMDDALVSPKMRAAIKRKHKKDARVAKRNTQSLYGPVGILYAFCVGFFSVLVARLAVFHLTNSQFALSEGAINSLNLVGDIVLALILTFSVMSVLQLRTRSERSAEIFGFVTMLWGEAQLAAMTPWLWTLMFSTEYAEVAVASAGLR